MDDVGDLKYVFTKMTSLIRFIQLIMQEYDSKCLLKMYLITLKLIKVFKIC
jgi:hypothetical protein